MLCKRCMTVMETGTTYEQNKEGKSLAKRFHECKIGRASCRERV